MLAGWHHMWMQMRRPWFETQLLSIFSTENSLNFSSISLRSFVVQTFSYACLLWHYSATTVQKIAAIGCKVTV